MKDTKTVREIIIDAGQDPDDLTMDVAGPVQVYVETSSGKIRKVTEAYLGDDGLVLRTGK